MSNAISKSSTQPSTRLTTLKVRGGHDLHDTDGYDQRIEVATADSYTRPPLFNFFMTRYIAAYAAEIAAFIDTLTIGSPTSSNEKDG